MSKLQRTSATSPGARKLRRSLTLAACLLMALAVASGGTGLTPGGGAGGNVAAARAVRTGYTTVVGRFLQDGSSVPFSEVTVTTHQLSATAATDGTFSIADVPADAGNIAVNGYIMWGGTLTGRSALFAPVEGGTTDVGDITLRPSLKVAVIGMPDIYGTADENNYVRDQLIGMGLFTQVDAITLTEENPAPTLEQLQEYDAVLVYARSGFYDRVALGDVLADYMHGDSVGVVMAGDVFSQYPSAAIGGEIADGEHLPFSTPFTGQVWSQYSGGPTMFPLEWVPGQGPVFEHILGGVTPFDPGEYNEISQGLNLSTTGTLLVATWGEGGAPLVAARSSFYGGRSVGLNFYPPFMSSPDAARLMANALSWSGG